jgi:hypothetical protein
MLMPEVISITDRVTVTDTEQYHSSVMMTLLTTIPTILAESRTAIPLLLMCAYMSRHHVECMWHIDIITSVDVGARRNEFTALLLSDRTRITADGTRVHMRCDMHHQSSPSV